MLRKKSRVAFQEDVLLKNRIRRFKPSTVILEAALKDEVRLELTVQPASSIVA